MRKCYTCEKTKKLQEFYRDKNSYLGYGYQCKKCHSDSSKKRRLANPEKYRERQKASLAANYESIRDSQRRHVEKNRDKINERKRRARELNREELNAKENARRKTTEFREYAREYQRKLREERRELTIAWQRVTKAISAGKLIRRGKCERCDSTSNIEGHHADYSKPLEVIWLCSKCHKLEHKKMKQQGDEW